MYNQLQIYKQQSIGKDMEHNKGLKLLKSQWKTYMNDFNKIKTNNTLKIQEIEILKNMLSQKESDIEELKRTLTASYEQYEPNRGSRSQQ